MKVDMKLSCGTIIVNEFEEILMGKVTGTHPFRYDLPKGNLDEGEERIDAAIRECIEEFGLVLDRYRMGNLGEFEYIRDKKNLHLFLTFIKKDLIDLDCLQCSTNFTNIKTGEEYPEMNGYAWIHVDDIGSLCGYSMNHLLRNVVLDDILRESKYGELR